MALSPHCIYFGNFYPRPPRGGRLDALYDLDKRNVISTHALREEGDWIHGLRLHF